MEARDRKLAHQVNLPLHGPWGCHWHHRWQQHPVMCIHQVQENTTKRNVYSPEVEELQIGSHSKHLDHELDEQINRTKSEQKQKLNHITATRWMAYFILSWMIKLMPIQFIMGFPENRKKIHPRKKSKSTKSMYYLKIWGPGYASIYRNTINIYSQKFNGNKTSD